MIIKKKKKMAHLMKLLQKCIFCKLRIKTELYDLLLLKYLFIFQLITLMFFRQ